jgi:hypothetical protein
MSNETRVTTASHVCVLVMLICMLSSPFPVYVDDIRRLMCDVQTSFESVRLSFPCFCQHCRKTSICNQMLVGVLWNGRKQSLSAMARQHLGARGSTFEKLRNIDSPPLCTPANPSSRNSSLSVSHSRLARVSHALQLAPIYIPAQPVLKILLSLYTHQLLRYDLLER